MMPRCINGSALARRLAGPCRVFSSAAAATNHAAVSDALTLGGDSRLLLDAAHGWNKYFCPPRPVVDNAVLRGSCTCSPPTAEGYAHALERHAALEPHRGAADYATHFEAEMESVRSRLGRSLGLTEGTGIVLAASGTDAEYVPLAIAQELYPGATVHSVLAAKEEELTALRQQVPPPRTGVLHSCPRAVTRRAGLGAARTAPGGRSCRWQASRTPARALLCRIGFS